MCAVSALAAACSTAPPSGTGTYKVGRPYAEEGVWYYPREQPDYDETGIASWYGDEFHGRRTANGEVFDKDGLTAAHATLPLPVNVRVTNLENGRSLVLRVNDRGPFARGRIIDVSEHAAQLLGFYGKGTAKVRVTYLARADLPNGAPAAAAPSVAATAVAAPTSEVQTASLDPVAPAATTVVAEDEPAPDTAAPPAPQSTLDDQDSAPDLAPPPDARDLQPDATVAVLPVPASTHIYVQAGAFAQRDNAEHLVDRLSSIGNLSISSIDRNGRLLYRVRIGPYDDVDAADAALARLTGLGSSDAKIVVDQ